MALGKQTDAFLSELRRGNGVKRMADLIDRKAAIDALHEWEKVYTWDENCLEDREKVYAPSEVIEDLPDVEPERKKGKWIITSEFEDCYYAKCNQCNITQVFYFNKQLTKFCPECGVPMDLKGD